VLAVLAVRRQRHVPWRARRVHAWPVGGRRYRNTLSKVKK
jgi:hypothetical protein